ncbi:conserved hypothetical protein [Neospora caninum Liverpool]|uniref:Uncharacterized protein n=1 Tax=Neospora caninum (strain Liverpool) TaxID=572307 RepID=F0VQZ7_NEOCL|nr:conserved hypothetical protein [Neospora caninum Liverpool]CBZ56144.1 conserved hypothetical protein [Neospora caninum Liverpool]CEL70900.1 TPA: hypothetical protein BN1204_065700 [Neospora caninum Liverpool]|eukprot:XP_003886170.1 conserved hypothetical protein [Neospora caninum Liverpool]
MLSAAQQQQQLLQFDWQARGLQQEEDRSCWYAQHLQQHQLAALDSHAVHEAHHVQNESQTSGGSSVHAPPSRNEAPAAAPASSSSHVSGQLQARRDGLTTRAASYHVQEDQADPQAALREQRRQEIQALHFLQSAGTTPSMSPQEFLMRQQIFQQQHLHHLQHLQQAAFPHALNPSAQPQHSHLASHLVTAPGGAAESPQVFLHQGYESFSPPLSRGSGDAGVQPRSENDARPSHELSRDTSRSTGYGVGSEDFRAASGAPLPQARAGLRAADGAEARSTPPSDRGYPETAAGSPLKEGDASAASGWSPSQGACQLRQASTAPSPCRFPEDPQAPGSLHGAPASLEPTPGGGSDSGATATAGSAASDHASLSYATEPGSFSGSAACFPPGGNGPPGPANLLSFAHPPSGVSAGYGNQFPASGRFLVGGYPSQAQGCGGGYGPPGFLTQFGAHYANPHLMHPFPAPHVSPHQLPPAFAPSQPSNGAQMVDFSYPAISGSAASNLPASGAVPAGDVPHASPSTQAFPSLHMSPSLHHPSASHLLPVPGPSTPTKRSPNPLGYSSRRGSQRRQGLAAAGTPSTACTPPPFTADSLLLSASTGLPSEASSLYSGSRRSSAHSALGRDSAGVVSAQDRLFFDETTGTFSMGHTPGTSHSRRSSKTAANSRGEMLPRAPGMGVAVDSGKTFAWPRNSAAPRSSPGVHAAAGGEGAMVAGSDGVSSTATGKNGAGKSTPAGGAGKESGAGATGNLRGPYAVFATQIAVPPPPELEEACQRLAEFHSVPWVFVRQLKAQPLIQQWLDSRDVSWSFAFALVFNARLAAGSVNVNVRWAREPTVVGGAFLVGKGKTYSWRRAPQEASPHIILQCFEAACKERQKTFGRSQHVDDYLAVLKTDLATAWRLDAEGLQQAADSLIALHGLDIFCGLPVTSKQVKDLLYFDPHANCFSLAPESPPLPPLHCFFPGPQDASSASDLLLGITKESAALAAPDSVHSSAPPSPSGDLPSAFGMRCTYTFRCPAPDCLGLLYTLNRVRLFCLNAKLRSSASGPSSDVLETSTGFDSSTGSVCNRPSFSIREGARGVSPSLSSGLANGGGCPPGAVHAPADFSADVSHVPYPNASFPRAAYDAAVPGSGYGGKDDDAFLPSAFASGMNGAGPRELEGADPEPRKEKGFELAAFAPAEASLSYGSSPRGRTVKSPRSPVGCALYERLVQGASSPSAGEPRRGAPGNVPGDVSGALRDEPHETGDRPLLSGVGGPKRDAGAAGGEPPDSEHQDEEAARIAPPEAGSGQSGARAEDEKEGVSPRLASGVGQGNRGDAREAFCGAETDGCPTAHIEREAVEAPPGLLEFGENAPSIEGAERHDSALPDEAKGGAYPGSSRPARRSASRGYAKVKKRRRPLLAASRRKAVHLSCVSDEAQEASLQDEGEDREKDDDSEQSSQLGAVAIAGGPASTLRAAHPAFASASLEEPCSGRKLDCSAAWMAEERADRHLEAFFSACVDERPRRGEASEDEKAEDRAGSQPSAPPSPKRQKRGAEALARVNEGEAEAGEERCPAPRDPQEKPRSEKRLRDGSLGEGEDASDGRHTLERVEEEREDAESEESLSPGSGSGAKRGRRGSPAGDSGTADEGLFFEGRESHAEAANAFRELRALADDEKGAEENTGLRFLDDPNTPSLSPTDPASRGGSRVGDEDEEKGGEEGKTDGRRRRDGRARRTRR